MNKGFEFGLRTSQPKLKKKKQSRAFLPLRPKKGLKRFKLKEEGGSSFIVKDHSKGKIAQRPLRPEIQNECILNLSSRTKRFLKPENHKQRQVKYDEISYFR